ncbi:MAG TPA: hypothetical protein VKH43_09080, partial [Thermoanaerobaculia bacterium]|nr:hypothetical protein [Thermoanaerobaculia bacterium]
EPGRHANIVEGFGDLVVLVNPAFEASLYLTLRELSRSLERLSPLQTPVLITVQSESDMPNGTWFPLGQWLATIFQHAANRSEKVSMRTSVGNYEEFWDYRLAVPAEGKTASRPRADSLALRGSGCVCDLDLETSDADLENLMARASRLTSESPAGLQGPAMTCDRSGQYGRSVLTCLKPQDRATPFWVIRASDEVIHGHNGIFTNPFNDFVRQVVFESLALKARRSASRSEGGPPSP